VILTVLNEGEAVRGVLESLCRQTRPPDEVVIADGGSRDQTLAVLREYAQRLPLRIVSAPGKSPPFTPTRIMRL
jgi:glycosyltransferase involved in cell wall biosynthesis